jgi:hypothetical protein
MDDMVLGTSSLMDLPVGFCVEMMPVLERRVSPFAFVWTLIYLLCLATVTMAMKKNNNLTSPFSSSLATTTELALLL